MKRKYEVIGIVIDTEKEAEKHRCTRGTNKIK